MIREWLLMRVVGVMYVLYDIKMEVINLWKGCVVRFRMFNSLKGSCMFSYPSIMNSTCVVYTIIRMVNN